MNKIKHPGWAVKYPNNPEGEWVAQYGGHGGYGCSYDQNPSSAETYKTKEEAEKAAKNYGSL